VDLVDRKLQFAREFGATHTVNATDNDPVKGIWAIKPGGVDYAVDAVGAPTTALQILEAVRQGGPRADNQGGTAVLLGIPVADVSVDLTQSFCTSATIAAVSVPQSPRRTSRFSWSGCERTSSRSRSW